MAKQLNVSLGISADTSQAKAQIQDLQKSLQAVATLPAKSSSLFDDVQLKKASQAAMELEQHLNKAVNVNTGKLDLSRFSSSLKASNKDLNSYCTTLLSTGATGRQAFLQLAQAIASADTPVTRINAKVAELGTTLKNTARWQISSSILHGFMGAVQSAYGYAQDLNESLNNIRIVTGKSTETMDEFAVKANKAARALSTSTTAYTDAALIFYQQGLDDSQVEERTNATIKMAHAAGESATEVSSYMTAIWNNFDDGSKSLEYYGDVMAHLGAKTAASSAEIAEGLEKFAAIGDTVGLSYEYAASAVATVVDKTRQSADTVGTAFKTIFARLQGLQLGETLDDGTDLNKYSKALMSVGINIKDTNGQLKDTDVILDELGQKWQTLERDEKSALAQTVAGTRQYTQLISLMDNYSDFKDNVASASASEGTLSIQADIYAESWEAAQERVKAAAEDIYDSIIDDDFFITLLNGFEKVLDTIGGLVDGLGGMKGIIMMISSLFLTSFANKMPEALSNLRQNFMVFTGQAKKAMHEVQSELDMNLQVAKADPNISASYKVQLEGIETVNNMKQKLVKSSKNLTEQEKQEYEAKIRNVEAMYKEVAALEEKREATEKALAAARKGVIDSATGNAKKVVAEHDKAQDKVSFHEKKIKDLDAQAVGVTDADQLAKIEASKQAHIAALEAVRQKAAELEGELTTLGIETEPGKDGTTIITNLEQISGKAKETADKFVEITGKRAGLESLVTSVKGQGNAWKEAAKEIQKYEKDFPKKTDKALKNMTKNMDSYLKKIKQVAKEKGIEDLDGDISALEKKIQDGVGIDELIADFEKLGKTLDGKTSAAISEMDNELDELRTDLVGMDIPDNVVNDLDRMASEAAEANQQLDNTRENVRAFGEEAPQGIFHASTAVTQFGSAVMSAQMLVTSWQSAMDIFNDSSSTGFEKLGAVLSIVTATMATFNAIQALSTTLSKADAIAKMGQAAGQAAANLMAKIGIGVKSAETGVVVANTAAWYANPVMWIALIIVAVIAAVVALIAAIASLTEWLIKGDKIETENCDTLIENAEKTKELAEANEELSDSMDDLIEEYKEMNEEGENTSAILQQIQDNMPELINSYKELAKVLGNPELTAGIAELERLANIAALTGDYSAFEKKKEEVDNQVAIETAKAAESGAIAANTVLAAKMQETQGKVSGKKYTLDVGGADGNGSGEEKKAQDILMKNMNSGDRKYAKNSDSWFKSGVEMTVSDYSDPLEFVDYYEKMVAARDEMLRTMTSDEIAESDIFREIDEQIRGTASEYEKAKEQADAYLAVAGKAVEADLVDEIGTAGDVETMEQYLAYKDAFIKKAKEEYNMTTEQAEAYLAQSEALGTMNNKYELAAQAAEKFFDVEDFENMDKGIKTKYLEQFEALTKDLSDEDFALAVNVIADADSIEEFENEILRLGAQAETARYEMMGESLTNMMASGKENGSLSSSDMDSLKNNEDFNSYLEESGGSFQEFSAASFDEQYNMLSEFYSKVQALRHDSVQYQKSLYYDDMKNYVQMLDKMYAMDEDDQKKSLEMKEAYADKQAELNKEGLSDDQREKIEEELEDMEENYQKEFGWSIDLDTGDVKNKMQEIEDQIKALDQQQIEIAIEWDGIEEIEKSFEDVGDFAKTMQKDAKKVGNSYQLTAAQAREWMEVYPDLFKQAEVTSDGLISLDQSVVDNYISGQEGEVEATVDAKIAQLEAERETMEAKLKLAEADLEACYNNYKGQEDLANVSAEYLADQRKNLTQYYMDLGMDEVNADKAALETMGLNEEEYTNLVAEAAEVNANNQIDAAESGGKAQSSVLSKLAQKWSQFTSLLKKVGAAVKAALTGGDVSEAWNSIDADLGTDDASFEGKDLSGHTFKDLDEQTINAARESVNSDLAATLEANKANIQNALDSIDSQIVYLQSLKNQDLSDYGSTDPDDVDGSNDSSGGKDKTIEEMEEVLDRYHEINREIEYQEHLLDQLDKAADRAFGKDKLDLMDQQEEALQKLLESEQDLLLAQTAFLASDLTAVQDAFGKNNVKVDPESQEINYTELKTQAAQRLNDAKKTYNNSSQDDAAKKALEDAEKAYENEVGLLDQYEETLTAWREQQAKVTDRANALLDKQLEKIQYKVDLQIEFSDDELGYLEHMLGRIEDKAFSAADAIANIGKQTKAIMNKNDAYKSGIMSIFGNHGLTEEDMNKWLAGDASMQEKIGNMSFTESEVDALREYTQGLMDNNEALIEMRQTVHDKMLESFDEWNEKIDKNLEKLNHLKSMTEAYRNIVDIIGKANIPGGDELIARLNQSSVNNAKNSAEANIANRDRIAAQLQATRDAYDQQKDAISEEERKMWEETIEEMESQLDEAEETALSSISEWMEAINQQFIDSVESTMDKFADTVAGKFGSLTELQEAFERKQSENDRYLEDYEKIYEFSKLNRDIEKSIDNTSNVKAKKELASLQAEINELEESGAEISEYQMENLRKRYELKLAELALEEAKNAKSEVRMTRDSEGNWGYVYTADEAQVAEAEQSYEDKMYALQQQNAEYINTLQENIIQMQVEMKEKMAEIANDESLSIEERQAKMAEVQAYYKEQMDYYCSELGVALGNNKTLYEDDWTKYSEATGYKIAEDAKYIDSFEETDLAVLTGFTNMEGYQAAFNAASDTMLADNNTAFENWQSAMETGPLAAMDTSFDTLAENIDGHLDTIDQESDNTKEAIKEDCEDAVENYQGVVDAVVAWETQYSASVTNMIADSDTLITKFQEVLALWADVKAAANEELPTPDDGGGGGDGGDGGGDGGSGGGGGGDGGGSGGGGGGKPEWDRVVAAYNKINQGKWGNGISNRIKKGAADGFSEAEVRAGQQLINYTYPPNLNGYGYSRDKAKQLMGYDTGGYTGAWGDSGKLALLHEKELVLNKEDTANMLTAIDMIRQISSMIDLNAMSSMKGLGGMLTAGGVGQTMGGIEQHIEIHASFPDATDHSEIEEAFHNLLNSASQYANRKL